MKCSLQPHQLRELCVMAGLDPAAPATHSLVEAMLARKDQTGRISFDACMQVACHYQVKYVSGSSYLMSCLCLGISFIPK